MKGASLPINMLIILIIAVIVLIASIALFTGVWGQSSSGLSLDAAKNSGCHKYVSLNGCTDSGIKAEDITINKVNCETVPEDGEINNLQELSDNCFGGIDIDTMCNC